MSVVLKIFHVSSLTILCVVTVENVVWDSGTFNFLQIQVVNG